MSTLAPSEAEPLRRRTEARAPVREDEAVPGFDVLYRRWFRFTWSMLRRLGVPQPAIEDAAQEVWVIVHRRLDALESPRAVRSWLFQIARRVAARHRRGEQRSRRKIDALGRVPERPDLPHADRDSQLTVETLLGQLDATKREAFVLSELEGWSAPEIAKAAGTNPNTVYSRIRLARKELRAGWEARHPDADLELALADLREQSEPPKGAAKRCWLVLAPKLALGSGQAAVTGVAAVATWKLALAGAAVLGLAAVGGTYVGRGGSGEPTEHAASRRIADAGSRERGGDVSTGRDTTTGAEATKATPRPLRSRPGMRRRPPPRRPPPRMRPLAMVPPPPSLARVAPPRRSTRPASTTRRACSAPPRPRWPRASPRERWPSSPSTASASPPLRSPISARCSSSRRCAPRAARPTPRPRSSVPSPPWPARRSCPR